MRHFIKSALVLSVLLVSLLYATKVNADIGPKPSLEVRIIGLDIDVDFDLLIYRAQLYEDTEYRFEDYYQSEYPDRLIGYWDEDGFASCTLYNGPPCIIRALDPTDTGPVFKMGYFNAPRVFKVALVTSDGHLIVSEIANRTLYDSVFTYDLTGVDTSQDAFGVGVLSESLPIASATGSFFLRVGLTITIELVVLALFMYKKRSSFKLVALVNLCTQTLLTFGVIVIYYKYTIFGAFAVLLLGELLVFIVEIAFYATKLDEHSRYRAMAYGFVANVVSFGISFLLMVFTTLSN